MDANDLMGFLVISAVFTVVGMGIGDMIGYVRARKELRTVERLEQTAPRIPAPEVFGWIAEEQMKPQPAIGRSASHDVLICVREFPVMLTGRYNHADQSWEFNDYDEDENTFYVYEGTTLDDFDGERIVHFTVDSWQPLPLGPERWRKAMIARFGSLDDYPSGENSDHASGGVMP
jgi:hypothetical protein